MRSWGRTDKVQEKKGSRSLQLVSEVLDGVSADTKISRFGKKKMRMLVTLVLPSAEMSRTD